MSVVSNGCSVQGNHVHVDISIKITSDRAADMSFFKLIDKSNNDLIGRSNQRFILVNDSTQTFAGLAMMDVSQNAYIKNMVKITSGNTYRILGDFYYS
jgi:hypothetical protein